MHCLLELTNAPGAHSLPRAWPQDLPFQPSVVEYTILISAYANPGGDVLTYGESGRPAPMDARLHVHTHVLRARAFAD
eukprot:5352352-Pleurochrysis_carterae.AAC.2